jgi:N-acetylmuramoyl-L-alanine amidase
MGDESVIGFDRSSLRAGVCVRLAGVLLCALGGAVLLAASAGWAESGDPAPGAGSADRFDVVVLDAGHGGHDEGATGPSGLREKDLVLDVAKRLAIRLRKSGIQVVLTRDGDRFLSLEERTSVANDARADLFLSIHANASRSRSPKGVETYFASLDATDDAAREVAARENDALGAVAPEYRRDDPLAAILGDLIETQHLQESSEFAKIAQHELSAIDRARSRGVKQAPFVVLMGVQMPASLVEIGFITNPTEEKGLRNGRRRDAIAEALAEAVTAFGSRYDARRGIAGAMNASPHAAR